MALRIAIVYASWHGHVRTIAQHLASIGALRGARCELYEAGSARHADIEDSAAIIVTGSVHFGRYARALRRFVARERSFITSVPSAFVSVSGSAAALDGRAKAEETADAFLTAAGWRPDLRLCVGGALLYTKYGLITRLAMKFASRVAGRGTDTSRDYDYTNWPVVDAFMHQFVDTIERYRVAVVESKTASPV